MEQVVYTSSASATVSAADVFDIVQVSARNNPDREITGFLVFTGGAFLQLVEGPAARLDELLGTLARDARHRDIEIVLRRRVSARSFPEWKMRRFDATIGNASSVLDAVRASGVKREVIDTIEGFLLRAPKAA